VVLLKYGFQLLLIILTLIGTSLPTSAARPFPMPILSCGITPDSFNHVPTLLIERNMPQGLTAEAYDLTGDTAIDFVIYSVTMLGFDNNEFLPNQYPYKPLFYEIDVDGDNKPDALYIDKRGDGLCKDLSIYINYNDNPFGRLPFLTWTKHDAG